jgi:hypothetical protein
VSDTGFLRHTLATLAYRVGAAQAPSRVEFE